MSDARPRHLLHVFPTFAVGGSQRRFAQLARLHGGHYRHTVIALDGISTMTEHLPRDVGIDCIAEAFKTKSPVAGIMRAWRTLKHISPDVLVTYNWGAMDWGIAKRFWPALPHVHIEDGFGPEEKSHQLRRRVLSRRFVLDEPHTMLAVPSRRLETIALEIWRLPGSRLRYIPNGIDCARFAPKSQTRNPDEIAVGTVATLRPEKNLARLIDLFCKAAARRPGKSMKLVIVGDGAEREALQQAAAQCAFPGNIVFTGATHAPEKFLSEMDIFALSSDTEQMPLSVLEAMAAGLPVVSFDVGDLPAMVAPENLAMVSIPLADDAGYVENLLGLIDNALLRNRIGEANRGAAMSRFDEKTMAAAYAELFG